MVTSDLGYMLVLNFVGYPGGNDRCDLEHKSKAWARDTDSAVTSALIVMRVGETIQVCCLGSERKNIEGSSLFEIHTFKC